MFAPAASWLFPIVVFVATVQYITSLQLSIAVSGNESQSGAHLERAPSARSLDAGELCGVMEALWKQAAKLVGANYGEDCGKLYQFYRMEMAATKSWEICGQPVNYVPVWKSANHAIMCNLDAPSASHSAPYVADAMSFTFVRNPTDHFVSGYSEVNFKAHACSVGGSFLSLPEDSTDRAKQFIVDLLEQRLYAECWATRHVFSQLSAVKSAPVPLHFIGHLETFDAGWVTLGESLGCSLPRVDGDCGSHPSTDAASGYAPREAMESEMREEQTIGFTVPAWPPPFSSNDIHSLSEEVGDVRLNEALDLRAKSAFESRMQQLLASEPVTGLVLACSVLLPDYVCFHYDLPFTEEQCVEVGFASSVTDWRLKIDEIRQTLC